MSSWKVDATGWPIVLHVVEGSLSNAEIDAYVQEGTAVFLSAGPHLTILDTSLQGNVTAYMRARCVAWFKTHRAELGRCTGIAYVIRSPLMRFINMTVLYAIKLPMPYAVCETREEALEWARRQISGRA